jgi:tetratricopeptide (TPR) repeat protein
VRDAVARVSGQIEQRFAGQAEVAATVRMTLGETEFRLGNLAAAAQQLRQALTLMQTSASPSDPSLQQARYELALILSYDSKFDEAKDLLRQADRYFDEASAPPALATAANYAHGMILLQQQDRISEAIPYFQHAIAAQQRLDVSDHGAIVQIQTDLAQAFVYAEQYDKADALLHSMLASDHGDDPVSSLRLSKARMVYGEMLTFQKRYAEAEAQLVRAHDEMSRGLGADNYRTTKALADLAAVYGTTGQWQRAEETYLEVNRALTRQVGADSAFTLTMLGWLGAVYEEAGKPNEAIPRLRQARDTLGSKYPEFGKPYVHCFGFYLASADVQINALDEAQSLLESIDPASALSACDDDPPFSARLEGLKGMILLGRNQSQQALPLLQDAERQLIAHQAPDYMLDPIRRAFAAHPTS